MKTIYQNDMLLAMCPNRPHNCPLNQPLNRPLNHAFNRPHPAILSLLDNPKNGNEVTYKEYCKA
jgi:hypothetical protein